MNLKPPELLPKGIKHKLKTIEPRRSLLSTLPRGDKAFSRFQKGLSPTVFLRVQYSFTKTINRKSIYWTLTGYATPFPWGNKAFSRFQKGLSPLVFLKPPVPFPTAIKWKENAIEPLGSCIRSLPPGDKAFSMFQKGLSPPVFLKTPVPFPTPIKWKEYSIEPLGSCIRSLPRGDKAFQDFIKACHRSYF